MIRRLCLRVLHGVKEDTGANIEVLLLKQEEEDQWETLVKPAKRIKEGTDIVFGEGRLKAICTGEQIMAVGF